MDMKIDKNSPIPLGVQVKEQIKMFINCGIYKPLDKLPSIIHIATMLDLNKNTVVTILKELEYEGFIECYRGKGIFVSSKRVAKPIDDDFLKKVDMVVREADKRNVSNSELLSLINARMTNHNIYQKPKAVFIMGISKDLVDVNVQKLKQRIKGVQFEGLFIEKENYHEKVRQACNLSDFVIIPSFMFDTIKEFLPKEIPVVKTRANFGLLENLKKGTVKKSKIAVIGLTQSRSQMIANMFISSGLFRPRYVISVNEIEEYKKDLKDIDTIVVCLSARNAMERLKLKEKEIIFFSDYIDEESMEDIRAAVKKL